MYSTCLMEALLRDVNSKCKRVKAGEYTVRRKCTHWSFLFAIPLLGDLPMEQCNSCGIFGITGPVSPPVILKTTYFFANQAVFK